MWNNSSKPTSHRALALIWHSMLQLKPYFLKTLGFTALVLFFSGCEHHPFFYSEFACDIGETIVNTTEIEGYSDKNNYAPGETMELFIHSFSGFHRLEIWRFGVHNDRLFTVDSVPGFPQNFDCYAYSNGCNWLATYSFKIPEYYNSGYYSVKLIAQNGEIAWISFIVSAPKNTKAKLVVVASSNTWQAYNTWGGGSFYRIEVRDDIPFSSNINFHRPSKVTNPSTLGGHLFGAELNIIRWLESMAMDYRVISDRMLHDNSASLDEANVVLLTTHPEYYTSHMLDNLEMFHANGGNIMVLGGNALYWRVVINPEKEQLEVRKKGTKHYYENVKGGLWRDLDRPEAALIGCEYTKPGYGTFAPYKVLQPNHWAFAGTNLLENELFGESTLTNSGGASGHETDKMGTKTPENALLLAKGTNPDEGGAEMVIIENDTKGDVFTVGSVAYSSSLLQDSLLTRITTNVLLEFLK